MIEWRMVIFLFIYRMFWLFIEQCNWVVIVLNVYLWFVLERTVEIVSIMDDGEVSLVRLTPHLLVAFSVPFPLFIASLLFLHLFFLQIWFIHEFHKSSFLELFFVFVFFVFLYYCACIVVAEYEAVSLFNVWMTYVECFELHILLHCSCIKLIHFIVV